MPCRICTVARACGAGQNGNEGAVILGVKLNFAFAYFYPLSDG